MRLGYIFCGPQTVRPCWEKNVCFISERLWILKHLPLWKTPPGSVKLALWLLSRWGNQESGQDPLVPPSGQSNRGKDLFGMMLWQEQTAFSVRYCGFCICPGRQKQKTQSYFQDSMKLLPGKFTFGDMCVFLWVCVKEKERKVTTQVLWRGKP